MSNDVCEAALKILQGKVMNSLFNQAFIALKPKVKNLELVSEFRHISLCNVLYKVVSKVIVNQLMHFIQSII